LQPDGQMF